MPLTFSRQQYAELFGPTVGDLVRLGDTELFITAERDLIAEGGGYGNEVKFGGGKVIRDGMGQSPTASDAESLDLVITNALLLDAEVGILKADIGIKNGRIVGIGHAGNPGIQSGIGSAFCDPRTGKHNPMIIGASTEVIAGEGCIITAGGIDSHIHFICPQQIDEAIASGITTMLGGGTGPATGTNATTCTPGAWNLAAHARGRGGIPDESRFPREGELFDPRAADRANRGRGDRLKLHEDWGTHAGAIDSCLAVADEMDVQVAIHTDTLNEAGFVERTLEAIEGPHHPHLSLRGSRGRTCPRHPAGLRRAEHPALVDESDAPLHRQHPRRASRHAHGLPPPRYEDSRGCGVRRVPHPPQTIAAEDILHDLGAISMISSDSQAMGRVGEVVCRTWQTADKMKAQFGKLESALHPAADNYRALRYIAKYTINPAITHGISHFVGSLAIGKFADLVVWKPAFFGTKPELILKGGMIACANMGDPNASIPTPQPTFYRPQFGSFGSARSSTSLTFVSAASLDAGSLNRLSLKKRLAAVKHCRTIGNRICFSIVPWATSRWTLKPISFGTKEPN
jgi:urease subunit alpha